MPMKKYIISTLLFLLFIYQDASTSNFVYKGKYVISLRDKNCSDFSILYPEKFLTPRSIKRRVKSNIPITIEDIPVCQYYKDSIVNMGAIIQHSSKWLNSVTAYINDSISFSNIQKLDFVDSIFPVEPLVKMKSTIYKTEELSDIINSLYLEQYTIHNNNVFLNNNWRGQGVLIAVIDAGFSEVLAHNMFNHLWDNDQIKYLVDIENRRFPNTDGSYHGSAVLSIIGGIYNNEFEAMATEADYALIRTEVSDYEYLSEEENWIVGVEFADSIGADIINTSLGYTEFDDPTQNHTLNEFNGTSTRTAKALNIAASKGILAVVSAGNDGNKSWHYIATPAEAKEALTVGAIDHELRQTAFTSEGWTAPFVKPEVVAIGKETTVLSPNNKIAQGNGTSFSSPIISGFAACILSALPMIDNFTLKNAIINSCSDFNAPNTFSGYGIPDFGKAVDLLQKSISNNEIQIIAYPTAFNNDIFISTPAFITDIYLINILGNVIRLSSPTDIYLNTYHYSDLSKLDAGFYAIVVETIVGTKTIKMIKKSEPKSN